jgi:putative transposase
MKVCHNNNIYATYSTYCNWWRSLSFINRANGRLQIFNTKEDYQLFEKLLLETKELVDMRILAYTILPNHFHLVLHPKKDGDLTVFMQRVSNTHTRKVHALTKTNGAGHLYQGRYKSFLVESNEYLLTLIKYVERNPVRAKLVQKCEDWQWGSSYRRIHGTVKEKKLLNILPTDLPSNYRRWINTNEDKKVLESIRGSVSKSIPYGGETWLEKMVAVHNLHSTLRSPGRPKKV